MQLDLYQRRGMFGLGDDPAAATDQPIPAYLQTAPVTADGLLAVPGQIGAALASGAPGVGGMSWSTLALIGIGTWWIMSALHSGSRKAYKKVSAPIKKHRKKKRELGEARERYERETKRIREGGSRSRSSGGFF